MLFDLPVRAAAASDCPESWIKNVEIVNLWAEERKYQLHDVNWFRMPDGSLVCSLPERRKITIPCPDALGQVKGVSMQERLDEAYRYLQEECQDSRYLWDRNVVDRWGKQPASENQLNIIRRRCRGFDPSGLTKGQASQILNRLFHGGRSA